VSSTDILDHPGPRNRLWKRDLDYEDMAEFGSRISKISHHKIQNTIRLRYMGLKHGSDYEFSIKNPFPWRYKVWPKERS
jgi:hypothetical protein